MNEHHQLTCLVVVTLIASTAATGLHDDRRGFQALRMSAEKAAAFTAQESPQRKQHQHRVAEAMKQHPEWQKLQAWKQRIKAGDPEAGAAYAGKLPHELLHHLVSDVADHVQQQEQDHTHSHEDSRAGAALDAEL